MKICDTLYLAQNELRYGKKEWVASLVLQTMIFSCAFFVLSLAFNMDTLGEKYLGKIFREGYVFSIRGYTEKDRTELEEMGFTELYLEDGSGSGTLHELKGLWINKIRAVLEGKDIWNKNIDEFITVLGIFQIIFIIISIMMIFVMINNISNSYSMKIMQRGKYIRMLYDIGAEERDIRGIFNIFFSLRNFFSLTVSYCINLKIIAVFNSYVRKLLDIDGGMTSVGILGGIGLFLGVEVLMRLAFVRIWGEKNADY